MTASTTPVVALSLCANAALHGGVWVPMAEHALSVEPVAEEMPCGVVRGI